MMGSTPYDTDDDWESEGELDLADDESLPWLEAADDEGDAAGFDTSRLIMLGTLAITLLAAVVGGIWFVTSQVSNEPEADGSLIEASASVKSFRPKDEDDDDQDGNGWADSLERSVKTRPTNRRPILTRDSCARGPAKKRNSRSR